jgi:RNA 2',3'-cyclic 3'-phosphodiesterase
VDDRAGPLNDTRLFLALWPAPAARAALAGEQARWGWPAGARRVAAGSLHLTLHYLGAVAPERVESIGRGLRVPCRRFTLRLDERACWPNRCAVLGPRSMPPALSALHEALARALHALALPVQARAFQPHVTLARDAGAASPPIDAPAVVWRVAGYALVRSEQGRYTPIARYACG